MHRSPLLSADEIASLNSVTGETIRRLYRRNVIPGYKVGRYLRFDPDEVRAALRSGSVATASPAVAPDFDALDAA